MSTNQYKLNPAKAISSYKGRYDVQRAHPSKAVSEFGPNGLASGSSWASIDGGTETLYSGYHAEVFTSGGTLVVSAPGYVEVLLVGGGGGGSPGTSGNGGGGGGGAGAVRRHSDDLDTGADGNAGVSGWVWLENGSYTVSIGAGGAPLGDANNHVANEGTQSYLQAPTGTPFHDGSSATAYMRAGGGGGGGGGTNAGGGWNQDSPTGITATTGGSGGGGGQGPLWGFGLSGGSAGAGGGTLGYGGGTGGFNGSGGSGYGGNHGGGGGGAGGNASGLGSSGNPITAIAGSMTAWEGGAATSKYYGGGGGGHRYAFDGVYTAYGAVAGTNGMMATDNSSGSLNTTGSGGWGRSYSTVGNGQSDGNTNLDDMQGRANSGGGGGGHRGSSYTYNYAGAGGSGICVVRVKT